ncbi:unnamed protein product [Mytilus coruscus]|uniref:B box-type domain-containing protein n=1 Tax=Mytilus coruscus TaxID=42192 RepID=A0A6J8E7C6_MYTCO|nr:unnamed protein product [Mytilus coruscus]
MTIINWILGRRLEIVEIMECQPCREQGQHASAEFWCTECEEALCENCKSLHRSFKVSRNHNVSALPPLSGNQSSDKQKELVDNGKDKWVKCDEHHDKYLEYFCIKHEKPCCILCKRQYHRDCCEVEKIDDVADESKLATTTVNLLSGIEKRKNILTEAANNEISLLGNLETIKVNCIEELKNTRITIDKHLDFLQNEVEQDINKTYENDSRELSKRVKDLSAKIEYITDLHKIIDDTANQSKLSLGQKYLTVMRLKHMEDGNIESQETLSECNLQGITNFKLSYEKTEDSITIRINRNLPKTDTKLEKSLENEDEIEFCSSVVELEQNESEADNFELSEPVPESQLTSPQTNVTSMPDSYPTTLPSELSLVSLPVTLSSFSVTKTTQIPCAAASGEGSQFEFFLRNSFFIEKRNKNILITDAKFMPNNFCIAITEKSNPRCMVYNKDGQKKGQVQLSGEPDSIAVIKSNRVAVTVIYEEKVCVIDTDTWQFINIIHVHDQCKGLVYFENYLIANCIDEGLVYINDAGQIVKQNSNITGKLYFHLDNEGNLYSAKMETKKVNVYNLTSNKRSIYHLKGLNNPTGMATDRENNLFVACNDNDTIFVKQSLYSPAKVVLDSSDGIERPMGIDYDLDNDELLVMNENARSIFLQNEVQQEINKTYENDRRELSKRVTYLTGKIEYVTDKIIDDTANQSQLSLEQKYSTLMRPKHMKDCNIDSQETLPECNLQGISNFKLSYEKTEDSITIRINCNLQNTNNKFEQSPENEDKIESCSSVFELEPNKPEADSFALDVPVPESP